MKSDAEIRMAGMQALINALGLIEAECFMASVSRDRFNYTEWRRHGLPKMSLDALAQTANRYADERSVEP
ncbi:MAG: hypothetical protein FD130_2232 [Halothiobacillaceae bacterium]|nr:MAG: hypothetical protein FD130_2232 [Halothiobacillaceae bacterium]